MVQRNFTAASARQPCTSREKCPVCSFGRVNTTLRPDPAKTVLNISHRVTLVAGLPGPYPELAELNDHRSREIALDARDPCILEKSRLNR